MRIVSWLAAFYIVAMLAFGWGLAAARYQVFPYGAIAPILDDVFAFVDGALGDDTSLSEKVLNDLGVSPERFLTDFTPEEPAAFAEVALPGASERRGTPRLRADPDAPARHRLIVGAFDFDDAFWGAILLDPEGKVLHRWPLTGEFEGVSREPDVRKNLYGVAFFPDGSAVYTMQQNMGGIARADACGRNVWLTEGAFHHTVTPTEDGSAFWTFGGSETLLHPRLVLIDVATGEILRTIDMADVARANPDTLIWDTRRFDGPKDIDATHPNDIEVLPASLASAFPMFAPGDLILSYRMTNLILVMDPETLEVKWWHFGAADGQHDPDWQPDGTITLFNNNFRAGRWGPGPYYSTIVRVDPRTSTHEVILDGADHDFFTLINGHHAMTECGVLVTSSKQGRVFETGPDGQRVWEFINSYDWDAGRVLHLSETFIIDPETARRWAGIDCAD